MRIAVAMHGYPPGAGGGVERVAFEQAEALVHRGHEVFVFARDVGASGPDGAAREDKVGAVPVWRVAVEGRARSPFSEYYEGDFLDAAFRPFLREVRPEVLHVQHLVTMSMRLLDVAQEKGIPTVLSLHDFYYACHRLFRIDAHGDRCPGSDAGARCVDCLAEHGAGGAVQERFAAMARRLGRCGAVTAPSRSLASAYEDEFPFLKGRIDVVEPGLTRLPKRRAIGARRGPLRVLFIGTCMPHKGLDVLIDALGRLPEDDFELAIYGEEVDTDWSAALRDATVGKPIRWLGQFADDQLSDVFGEADVFVLPSRCDESWSRVLREARAAGLAVVAPNTGGPADWLRHEKDGLLVEPGSVPALAEALARLRSDVALRADLSVPETQIPMVDSAAEALERIFSRTIESERVAERERLPRVTVAYVTKNGAAWLEESLRAVRAQKGDFELVEVLAVDSGSTDGTRDLLAAAGARVVPIAPGEFGHGRSRNLAAREALGDLVVFLTQDAAPANERWLNGLVTTLVEDPLCAAAWSLHVPRPECHPMEWRMLEEHPPFRDDASPVQSVRGDPAFARDPDAACSLSNNAAAYRREQLLRTPFPDVSFGEDRGWAREMLDAGWRTVLVRDSIVRHSHSYSAWVNLRRNFDHWRAMSEELGHVDGFGLVEGWGAALREARRDVAFWTEHTGGSRADVAVRWLPSAVGYHLGAFAGRWLGSRTRRLPWGIADRLSMHTLPNPNEPKE